MSGEIGRSRKSGRRLGLAGRGRHRLRGERGRTGAEERDGRRESLGGRRGRRGRRKMGESTFARRGSTTVFRDFRLNRARLANIRTTA